MFIRVILLITPLLRRMVTNERQRNYAIEARKPVKKGSRAGKIIKSKTANPPLETRELLDSPNPSDPAPEYPDIDPKLSQYPYSPGSPLPPAATTPAPIPEPSNSSKADEPSQSHMQYHINILDNGRRIKPRVTLTPSSCRGLSNLVQHVQRFIDDRTITVTKVQILAADGLRDVEDEEAWLGAIKSVEDSEWMDREVRVLVEILYAE